MIKGPVRTVASAKKTKKIKSNGKEVEIKILSGGFKNLPALRKTIKKKFFSEYFILRCESDKKYYIFVKKDELDEFKKKKIPTFKFASVSGPVKPNKKDNEKMKTFWDPDKVQKITEKVTVKKIYYCAGEKRYYVIYIKR